MDEYLNQHIEKIGENDGESKVRFSPAIGEKEKYRSNDDRNRRDDSIAKNTYEFHRERNVPSPLFLNFFSHMEIKIGYWMIFYKKNQSNNTHYD